MSADLAAAGRQLVQRRPRPNSPWEKRRAARSVAHHARDAEDCLELLEALGLTVGDGKAPPTTH